MKIALIGYGKMGQMIEKLATQKEHQIVSRVTSADCEEWKNIHKAEVCIEFSTPESVLENLEKICKHGLPTVIGTTGWYDKLSQLKNLIDKYQVGVLYSPNFSLGIHLFLKMIRHAAQLMAYFPEYAAAGIEYHHHQKLDSPSGTAKKLAQVLNEELKLNPPLSFSSVRCGTFPGTHTVLFDTFADTLSFTHEARSREGFAEGALRAAEWLLDKKGIYTFEECLNLEKFLCH
ncbi:dihydrodipicolinate reductase C-terminal domain-containing protein [Parachlamydia sp. AcF125]|uniref:4-hydroxy-tetrahydrodipicolinate reductase n=1 Tax=Parachlamydia sp. AcF125 TaxID=2795736 RepID=UPI001BC9CAE9|nr:dihydrodipicolinate reductase C-terminal domain-containing protein [Parachlamydia sp. AcF125]MBS4167924.1 4-hydroxy-tetrahydrodipicolinate reductase [Parachlamydia sp. AcF125]